LIGSRAAVDRFVLAGAIMNRRGNRFAFFFFRPAEGGNKPLRRRIRFD